jgi:transposase
MSVTEAGCSDHPTTASQNEERAMEVAVQKGRMIVDKIAKQLNVSIGSVYSVVQGNF